MYRSLMDLLIKFSISKNREFIIFPIFNELQDFFNLDISKTVLSFWYSLELLSSLIFYIRIL